MTENSNTDGSVASPSDRRQFKRATTVLNGNLYMASEKFPSVVLDLSVSGVRLKAKGDLPLGAPVTLALAGKVHLGGEVIWRQGDTVGMSLNKTPEAVASIMAGMLPLSYLEARRAA